jgi:hypothetical protein
MIKIKSIIDVRSNGGDAGLSTPLTDILQTIN